MEAKQIAGGICAPQGFTAAGIHAGIRKNKDRKDLAMIKSSVPCTAAAVYTQNKCLWCTDHRNQKQPAGSSCAGYHLQ